MEDYMIIDCHFHVDESMLTFEKMIEGMDKNGVAKTALIPPMNETMFEVHSTYQANLQRLFRFLILQMPTLGLKFYDGLVKDGYLKLYGESYKIFDNPDNELVAAAIDKYPERFLGWAAVNPLIPNSIEEAVSYLEKPGFIGIKAHPFMHKYSIKELDPIADICEKEGWPMLIHLSSETHSYKYLPEKYPHLKIIYAHAGLPFWKKLWKYIMNKPNVYVDTSSDYLTPAIVKMTVDYLGYKKILYGCDGPYGIRIYNDYDYSAKKEWINSLTISKKEIDAILGMNFLELIKK
jgi:uncharacterized protein